MKNIFISGIQGNMGSRYKAILEHLGHNVYGSDVNYMSVCNDPIDGYIICTPTKQHLADLIEYGKEEKPILCEKPITTHLIDLEFFDKRYTKIHHLITVVNQYKYLIKPNYLGATHYNYFKTGGDGLAWDCVNIIGLAKEEFTLNNTSPVWNCYINGEKLDIAEMDWAYIRMVINWLENPVSNWEYIMDSHRKVDRWLKS